MIYTYYYETTLGKVGISANQEAIVGFGVVANREMTTENLKETPLIKKAAKQLEEYLAGKRKDFDLPLEPIGTEFQKKVWQALCDIPYGETRSYKEVAIAVGNPKASRAVGMANNRNPLGIVIPCHRVIGANGAMVGYAGGLGVKSQLLELERENM